MALLLFLAAGCGGSPVPVNNPSSPLGDGGDKFGECVPDPSGGIMTNGLTVLENHSKGTVVVEQVGFYGARHLRFIRAVVVPIHGPAMGYSDRWPPARVNITLPGLRWNQRVPAVGAKVPPYTLRTGFRNLVIEMQPTANRATSAGVQVRYREDGQQYILRTHSSTLVIFRRSC